MVAAAGLAIAVLPRTYTAHGTLMVAVLPTMVLASPARARDRDPPMDAAREVLLGSASVRDVVRGTDFVRRHLATRAPALRARDWLLARFGRDPTTEDAVVETIRARQWITADATGTVTVGFQWSDAGLAQAWVEASLKRLLETRRASEVVAIGDLVRVLEAHLATSGREAAAVASVVQQKERQLGISGRRDSMFLPETDELTELESELVVHQRSLAAMEVARDRQASVLMGQLSRQLNLYAADHPIVRTTRERIHALSQPSPEVEALRAETRRLAGDVALDSRERIGASLLAELDLVAEADDPRIAFERGHLRTLLARYASQADQLVVARLELDAARAGFADRYRVVEPPRTPRRPTSPTPGAALLGAILGGVVFSIFASVVLELRGAPDGGEQLT